MPSAYWRTSSGVGLVPPPLSASGFSSGYWLGSVLIMVAGLASPYPVYWFHPPSVLTVVWTRSWRSWFAVASGHF